MIDIRLNFENKALQKIALLSERARENLDGAIKDAAFLIEGIAKKKISHGSRTGRVYRLYRGGKNPIVHQSSAPGEPPKTDTGRLVSSIRTNFFKLKAEVGSDVNYSGSLEVGRNRMKPRPWLQPSLNEAGDKIQSLIDRAINEALK